LGGPQTKKPLGHKKVGPKYFSGKGGAPNPKESGEFLQKKPKRGAKTKNPGAFGKKPPGGKFRKRSRGLPEKTRVKIPRGGGPPKKKPGFWGHKPGNSNFQKE